MTLKKILAAVDRFPQDEAVLVRALDLAKQHRAAVMVSHVVDLPRHLTLPAGIDTLRGQAEFAAHDRIQEAVSRNGTDPADIEIRIEGGSPALRLIEICHEFEPDLIVMRAHQKVKIAEKLLGSTTERVIATAQAPVLVVKRPAIKAYANALLATDGTDDASGALRFVAGLLPDAALHLVQVIQIAPQLEEAILRIGTDQAGLAAYRDELANAAREYLRACSDQCATCNDTRAAR